MFYAIRLQSHSACADAPAARRRLSSRRLRHSEAGEPLSSQPSRRGMAQPAERDSVRVARMSAVAHASYPFPVGFQAAAGAAGALALGSSAALFGRAQLVISAQRPFVRARGGDRFPGGRDQAGFFSLPAWMTLALVRPGRRCVETVAMPMRDVKDSDGGLAES